MEESWHHRKTDGFVKDGLSHQYSVVNHNRTRVGLTVWSLMFKSIWVLAFFGTSVSGQVCDRPADFVPIYEVYENQGSGTTIFSFTVKDIETWDFSLVKNEHKILKSFFTFTRNDNNYTMSLTQPLDFEGIQANYSTKPDLIEMDLKCDAPNQQSFTYLTRISSMPVNEFPPVFNTSVINVFVAETNLVPFKILDLEPFVTDKDVGHLDNEVSLYRLSIIPHPVLEISPQSLVVTKAALDYDSLPTNNKFIEVGVTASDGQFTASTMLKVHILNVDDLPPKFTYTGCPSPCSHVYYKASIGANFTGRITNVSPASIQAVDQDGLGAVMEYSILQGPIDYSSYFRIDPNTADVIVIKAVRDWSQQNIALLIQARESQTDAQRTEAATIVVSVQSESSPPIPFASSTASSENVTIIGAVLGVIIIIIIIILIIGMIYYRKQVKKAVHPHSGGVKDTESNAPSQNKLKSEGTDSRDKSITREHQRSVVMTDEQMKVDEEITTWLPTHHLGDIVDLSDEDTMRRKKNGIPPSSTKFNSNDSAFEESSEKKSGSDSSTREQDVEFDPVTEYAEVGLPLEDHVYVPDPTTESQHQTDQSQTRISNTSKDQNINNITTDSGVDETEYLSPKNNRAKIENPAVAYNKAYRASANDPDVSIYSDLISLDGGESGSTHNAVRNIENPTYSQYHVIEETVYNPEVTPPLLAKSSPNVTGKETKQSNNLGSEDSEVAEYSTPRSSVYNYRGESTFKESNTKHIEISGENGKEDEENPPEVPPRPKLTFISGLKEESTNNYTTKNSDENRNKTNPSKDDSNSYHYASVQKKLKKHRSEKHKTKENNSHTQAIKSKSLAEETSKQSQNSSSFNHKDEINGDVVATSTPSSAHKRRRRKRCKSDKQAHNAGYKEAADADEEDIYDGTKSFDDDDMEPTFYLDPNKIRIKRSTKHPTVNIDPDDTRYWITVTDD